MGEKRGLGRGLGGLIGDGINVKNITEVVEDQHAGKPVTIVPLNQIRKNDWQPRRNFDEQAHYEMVESIRTHGILQPLLLRKTKDGYQLIAGERRFRGAAAAGLTEVPARIIDSDDQTALELALVENLQRKDLDPIEEAEGYDVLIKKFGLTQELISKRIGKPRATIANSLRLLTLHQEIKSMLSSGELTAGHAKLLAGLEIPEEQILLAKRCVREKLSVRQIEKILQKNKTKNKKKSNYQSLPDSHINYLSDKLHKYFGTSVRITPCKTYPNGRKECGSIEICYYSDEDLDRILDLLGVSLD